MNPFQLTGMSFLAFYLLLGIAVVVGLRLWFRRSETANASPQPNLTDPYLIAYLRAGENEALRVATVSLLDRGLLRADGEKIHSKYNAAFEQVNRPIEKAILKRYLKSGEGHDVFTDQGAKSACNTYKKTLTDAGLLAGGGVMAQRAVPALIALGILTAVTATKIMIAFSQGRHNIGFLVALTILFAIIVVVAWRKRRTGAGDAMMNDLKDLFQRLKSRAKTLRAGGSTNEVALLVAVFGLSAITASQFPFLEKLYPAKANDGSGCGSSSSCSSGSSCSGGCGGGGCGG